MKLYVGGTAPTPGRGRVPKGEYWINIEKGIGQKGGTFISQTAKYLRTILKKGKPKKPKTFTSRGDPSRYDQVPEDNMRKLLENWTRKLKDEMSDGSLIN